VSVDPGAILDTLETGVAVLAPDDTVLAWSAPAARLTGVAADHVLGRSVWSAFPAARGTVFAETLGAVRADGQPRRTSAGGLDARVARGRDNSLIVSLGPANGTGHATDGGLDLAALTARLRAADRLARLGALLGGVVHDLNNSLAAIAAFAQMLRRDASTPEGADSAEVIHAEAMRASADLQGLIEFARAQPRHPQAVDVATAVARALALHRPALRKSRVETIVAIAETTPPVLADPQELEEVLLHAVMNAEQAIAAARRPGELRIGAEERNGRLTVLIDDSGPGLPPGVEPRLFDAFVTTKPAGLGLGLAISRELIAANGGRLSAHNRPGGGVRVAIELPLAPAR